MEIEKLITAIRLCGNTPKLDRCKNECAFYCGGDMSKCIPVMTKAVADALETLTAERDAAIADIPKCCFYCAKTERVNYLLFMMIANVNILNGMGVERVKSNEI